MIVNSIEIMFGGQAGDGSLTTGDLIAGVFKRMGLEVYTYKDFPSRIRGGHTNYVIRAQERRTTGWPTWSIASSHSTSKRSKRTSKRCVPADSSSSTTRRSKFRTRCAVPTSTGTKFRSAKIAKEELG